jgi:uncharacterized protein
MAIVLGWEFTLGEFVGGPLMIVLVALLFRRLLTRRLVDEAREHADRGLLGSMEGHAEMDMSVQRRGSIRERLFSREGFDSTAAHFVMDWAAVARDIFLGLLIAGAIAAWVPESFWRSLFLEHHGALSTIWGALIGPLVAVLSFVCSIGNVPLAAVLWNGGISFGGVLAFIFADLLILPILNIYRKYYGLRVAALISGVFFAAMVVAGLLADLIFKALDLVPGDRHAKVVEASVTWNYTTILNIAFLVLAAVLVYRFIRSGGLPMLRNMDEPMGDHHHHDHAMAHGS